MPAQDLIDALPDLTLLMSRDGTVLGTVGGHGLGDLLLTDAAADRSIDSVWPAAAAAMVKQLVRRAIAQRRPVEATFTLDDRSYEARACAQGPDRAFCTVRTTVQHAMPDELAITGEMPRPELDRRGFLKRYQETMSLAALQERPAAVAVVQLEGIADIARVLDTQVAEQALSAAILRIPAELDAVDAHAGWYLGQLSENSLAIVIEHSDRAAIDALVASICDTLRSPVHIGNAALHLTPYAGVALLGRDASSPRGLLDYARSAALEARRASSLQPRFFTETLRLHSLARLDIARELREAIDNGLIRLRYIGRHDLVTGGLAAQIGYLQWRHPLRGEVRPTEFLAVAETTGVAVLLSRMALNQLGEDFSVAAAELPADAKLSFGPLRHHLLHEDFIKDLERALGAGTLPAARLEVRIAERTFVALAPSVCRGLRALGIQIVVDEMGRSLGSLDCLARAPLHGVQLDRAWVTAVAADDVALKVCKAGISAAIAIGLTPIATGIDDEPQRRTLLALACRQGSGDFYPPGDNRFDALVRHHAERTGYRAA